MDTHALYQIRIFEGKIFLCLWLGDGRHDSYYQHMKEDVVRSLIRETYDFVVSKLPKKLREIHKITQTKIQ